MCEKDFLKIIFVSLPVGRIRGLHKIRGNCEIDEGGSLLWDASKVCMSEVHTCMYVFQTDSLVPHALSTT